MFPLRRSALVIARRPAAKTLVRRSITTTAARRDATSGSTAVTGKEAEGKEEKVIKIESDEDLLPPGAAPGTVPTDMEQATGLERLELIGKMHGVDVFDMRPLDASRMGTLTNPIICYSAGDEQYAGCTGFPADSHNVRWLVLSRYTPLGRCDECGNCIKMEYIGPDVPPDPHAYHEPKTFADYVRVEYHGYPEGFIPPGYKPPEGDKPS